MAAEHARGHLAMAAFSALVAGSFALGSLAANLIDPVALTALRFALAATVVGVLVAVTGRRLRPAPAGSWRWWLLGGLMAAYFVAMFEGLKTAPPVSAAAVFTLTPVMSAGFGWALLGQVPTLRIAAALALGALGALWVIFRGDPAAMLALDLGRGEAIYFAGCVAHALYTPLVARLNRGETAQVSTTLTLAAGAAILALLGAGDLARTDWRALPAIVWITVAYLSVFASAATFLLLQYAALRLPASKVMAYTYMTPLWVVVWQIALDGRVPGAWALVGATLGGIALALLIRNSEAARGPKPAIGSERRL